MSIEKALSDHAVALREHAEALKAYATAIGAQLAAGNVGKIVADALVNASDDAARQALQDKRDAKKNEAKTPAAKDPAPESATDAGTAARAAQRGDSAAKKPQVSEKPAEPPKDDLPSPAEGEALDYAKHVRPVMNKVIAAKGSEVVREMLTKLGVQKATELKADGLAAFNVELRKALS